MSSKDKLIEFLESANIWYLQYKESPIQICIETNFVFYYFNLDGSYLEQAKS